MTSDRLAAIEAELAEVKRGAVFPSCEKDDSDKRWLAAEVRRLRDHLQQQRDYNTTLTVQFESDLAAARAEAGYLKLQAQIQAQEMRTQRAIVRDCYQAATGAAGEPGDWNGAEPIRALVAERDAARAEAARLREAIQRVLDSPCHMFSDDIDVLTDALEGR